jgi:hypothetical protein
VSAQLCSYLVLGSNAASRGAGVDLRDVLAERRDLAKVLHCSVVGLGYIETLFVVARRAGGVAWLLFVLRRLSCVSAVAVRAAHEPCIALVLFGATSTLLDQVQQKHCLFSVDKAEHLGSRHHIWSIFDWYPITTLTEENLAMAMWVLQNKCRHLVRTPIDLRQKIPLSNETTG